MKNDYSFGVYSATNFKQPNVGFGLVWEKHEKYVHINLLFWELAIGKTGR